MSSGKTPWVTQPAVVDVKPAEHALDEIDLDEATSARVRRYALPYLLAHARRGGAGVPG
jgi:hypothetical protein